MRNLILVILLTVVVNTAWAQRFHLGAIGGMNVSQIDGDDLTGYDKKGWTFGIRSVATINESLNFSTELLYSERGSVSKDFSSTIIKRKLDLNYAEINFLFNIMDWYNAYTKRYKMQYSFGISMGRLVKTSIFDNIASESNFENYQPEFQNKDLSFMVGGSYFVTKKIGITGRFSRSLSKLFDANNTELKINKIRNFKGYFVSAQVFYML